MPTPAHPIHPTNSTTHTEVPAGESSTNGSFTPSASAADSPRGSWLIATQVLVVVMLLLCLVEAVAIGGWLFAPEATWWKRAAAPRVWLAAEQRDQWAAIAYTIIHSLPGVQARYSAVVPWLCAVVMLVRAGLLLAFSFWSGSAQAERVVSVCVLWVLGLTAAADIYAVVAQQGASPSLWLLVDAVLCVATILCVRAVVRRSNH